MTVDKKRICFYINNLAKGGAERVIVQLAYKFCESGYDTIVITSFVVEDEYELDADVRRIVLEEKQDTGSRILRNIRLIKKLRCVLKNEKPGLLISFMQEPNFRSILATWGLQTKSMISVRNDPKYEYFGTVGRFIAKYILPLADGCVFQTEEAKKWFPKKLQKKSRIIFNEVEDEFFQTPYKPQHNIVTIGRLREQKNQKLLIKAFSRIAEDYEDYTLFIYGDGPLKEKLQRIIDSYKLQNRIFLKGITDNVPKVLAQTEIFVLSSNYEGMPNVLLEAFAVGVPSISTDCPCGGPRTVIKNNENGILVEVENVTQMEIAIRKLLDNTDLKNKIGLNAKDSAKRFHPDIVFKHWANYVDYLLALD